MAVTTMAVIGGVSAAAGAASSIAAQRKAGKLAEAQANKAAPTVDINALDSQAREFARRNAADSAALEAQYNPGAAELRAGSMQSVLAGLPRTPETERLSQMIMAQAGQPLTAPTAQQYDSALTRQAVEQAGADLALGGDLPQDVRNLVARNALSRSGSVTGGLGIGRDITARDLGLTSLDLRNKRLANAAAIGAQEAALGQGNASLRQQNEGLQLQAEQFGRTNLFDSASFMENMSSGQFARALAAAQLGQNIAAPMSGLDPGSVVNLAVGNTNAIAADGQQDSALRIGAANQKAATGAQIAGTGLGFVQNYLNRPRTAAPVYTAPNYVQPASMPATAYNPNFSYQPSSTAFKSYFGT